MTDDHLAARRRQILDRATLAPNLQMAAARLRRDRRKDLEAKRPQAVERLGLVPRAAVLRVEQAVTPGATWDANQLNLMLGRTVHDVRHGR